MEQRRVQWGIIGCGSIAQAAVAPAIRWSNNGTLLAVASRDMQSAAHKSRLVGALRAYGSYQALLEDREVEAVYVGLPNGLHEEWVLKALEAGKHVLCEKALALSHASAQRMARAAKARKLRLVEAFMYRHHPQWDLVRRLLGEQAIGEVRALRAGFSGRAPAADHRFSPLGGGALYDLTCYGVDVARFLFHAEPLGVCGRAAWVQPRTAPPVDTTSGGALDFPGGRVATVGGSLLCSMEQYCVILGTLGRIEVERPFVPEWNPTRVFVERDGRRAEHVIGGANQFLHQVEHFSSLVLDPERDAHPAEDGVGNARVLELISRSAAQS
jgi:D-xylose 1-dehydrogenase (NADP+, D-xylono-1,5-lactone-forming)